MTTKPEGAEVATPATPEPEPVAPVVDVTPPAEPEKDKAWWEGKARAMEAESKRNAKRLAELEKSEAARIEAEKTDLQKWQDAAAKSEKEKRELELRLMRRDAAAKAKLPAEFVDRLKGETLEELEADAEALAKAIPAPIPPKGQPTNPGQPTTGETEAERRKRLGL